MNIFPTKRIYMDYAATTPVLPEVRRVMDKYWSKDFYNPSSIYSEGVRMKQELEGYRASVAKQVGVAKRDVVFTASGTESANLAILGTFEAYREAYPHKRGHMVTTSIEHPAVREAAEEVKRRGGDVSVVGVDEFGVVAPQSVIDAIRDDTFIVSVMLANNELGTVEPVAKIGRGVREARKKAGKTWPLLHTDASQAPNYLAVNAESLNADLMTLDGSKIYGPKGVGVLVVRPPASVRPMTLGGGQERGMRAGTENLALIAGFAKALELAARDREQESVRLGSLRNRFVEKLKMAVPHAIINTPLVHSLPNIVSVSVPGTLAEMMLLALDKAGVMVSVGSACSSNTQESGSYVIRAIGKPELAESTIRFSFGRFTKADDVERVVKIFREASTRGKIGI